MLNVTLIGRKMENLAEKKHQKIESNLPFNGYVRNLSGILHFDETLSTTQHHFHPCKSEIEMLIAFSARKSDFEIMYEIRYDAE